MKKRIFCLISFVLIMALFPISVFAGEHEGQFLIQPEDGVKEDGEDYYAVVKNDSYVDDDGNEYVLDRYLLEEVQTDASQSTYYVEYLAQVEDADSGSKKVRVPYLPSYSGKTVTFFINAVFIQVEDPAVECMVDSNEFTVSWSTKRKLVSIVEPSAITGLKNGVEKSNKGLNLPSTISVELDNSTTDAFPVTWNVDSCSYVQSNKDEQSFEVAGAITLPQDVDPNGLSTTVSVYVTVNGAEQVETPTASPSEGTFDSTTKVTLQCKTSDAVIYYTLDGSEPTTSSIKYKEAISLAQDKDVDVIYTVNAIAVKKDMIDSNVYSGEYTIRTLPTYTINISSDGHGSATVDKEEAKKGDIVTLSYKADKGYKFKQWDVTGTKITIKDGQFKMPAGNVTIKACYEAVPQYTVTFYTQHGSAIPEQKVYEGKKAKKPDVQTLSEYVFDDFYTDTSFTTKFDFKKPITQNTIVYLRWKAKQYYTVTFGMNGHGSPISPKRVAEGEKVEKPSDPYASGFNFLGWYRDSSGGDKYDFDDKVTKDFTIYARWEAVNNNNNNNYNNNQYYNNNRYPYQNTYNTSALTASLNGLTLSALPNAYARPSTQPFVYQQILPEGSVMCSYGGQDPVVDMKAYGTDPKNILNQQILATAFMNTLYNKDAGCYKTVDLYPVVNVNDGSNQIIRWIGTNYPAGAVFGVVWSYWDDAYIIPGVCDTNGTVILTNFRMRPQATLTLVVPMERVSAEVATKSSSAEPNGVTKVETTTTTTTTTTEGDTGETVETTPASSTISTTSTTSTTSTGTSNISSSVPSSSSAVSTPSSTVSTATPKDSSSSKVKTVTVNTP